jgi:hypothetical protein
MIKKLRFTILILLSIAIGSAVYLHHHNRLAKYSPELDRLIVDLDRQVSVAWEATSRLRTIMTETAPKLFPLEKLQKYIPKSDAPEHTPSRSEIGWTADGDATPDPLRQIEPLPETIYTWVDNRGIRHFSTTKPHDRRIVVETFKR